MSPEAGGGGGGCGGCGGCSHIAGSKRSVRVLTENREQKRVKQAGVSFKEIPF